MPIFLTEIIKTMNLMFKHLKYHLQETKTSVDYGEGSVSQKGPFGQRA